MNRAATRPAAAPNESGPRVYKLQVFVDWDTKCRIKRRRGVGKMRQSESTVAFRMLREVLDAEARAAKEHAETQVRAERDRRAGERRGTSSAA